MIGQYSLFELLSKYGINHNNIIGYKKDILMDKAEYNTIEYVLSFLRNELGISSKNIEKCPSILYCGVDNIRDNYYFLEKVGFNVLRINNCLHVLGTDSDQLRETYEYVSLKYGTDMIHDLPSILRLPVSRIKQVEEVCEDKVSPYGILSICVNATLIGEEDEKSKFVRSRDELRDAILVCEKYGIKYQDGGMLFRNLASDIEEVAKVCLELEINYQDGGLVFSSNPQSIRMIADVCNKYDIPYKNGGVLFTKTAVIVEEIIKACLEHGVSCYGGTVFEKDADNVRSVVEICKKYGIKYDNGGMIFRHTALEIEEVVNVCEKYGIDYKDGGAIFRRSASEIT